MVSTEECKKHINRLDLSDKEVEKIRDLMTAFVEAALDFVFDPDTVVSKEAYEKK